MEIQCSVKNAARKFTDGRTKAIPADAKGWAIDYCGTAQVN